MPKGTALLLYNFPPRDQGLSQSQ